MSVDVPSPRNRGANIRTHLRVYLETRIIYLHFAANNSMGLSSFIFFLVGSVKLFSPRVRFGRLRSSKVVDFDTSRKRVCDFLLVRHLGPIFYHFRDIARFVLMTPPLFLPNFGVFSLDQIVVESL